MKLKLLIALLVAAICLAVSCKKENACKVPACIQAAIDSSLARPVGDIYVEILSYKYQGATVYLMNAGCCDRFNLLWDENCNYLFTPSGGIGGNGDHTHPNFFNEAVFEKVIWKDPRN